MAFTTPIIGFTAVVSLNGTALASACKVSPPNVEIKSEDFMTLNQTHNWMQSIPTVVVPGTITVEYYANKADASVINAILSTPAQAITIATSDPTPATYSCTGFITKHDVGPFEPEKIVMSKFEFKCDNKWTVA